MPRSLSEIAFDHVEQCPTCSFEKNRLCSEGALLFAAVYEKCEELAGLMSEPEAKA